MMHLLNVHEFICVRVYQIVELVSRMGNLIKKAKAINLFILIPLPHQFREQKSIEWS